MQLLPRSTVATELCIELFTVSLLEVHMAEHRRDHSPPFLPCGSQLAHYPKTVESLIAGGVAGFHVLGLYLSSRAENSSPNDRIVLSGPRERMNSSGSHVGAFSSYTGADMIGLGKEGRSSVVT